MPWELPGILDPDMVREGWNELETLSRLEAISENMKSDRTRVCALEMQVYMRNRLLRDSDWAGMAHSIEIRVPFVDVDFFRSVVPMFGTSVEPTKGDLARVPCHPLPEAVMNRPKTGFGIPVREWLLGENNKGGGPRPYDAFLVQFMALSAGSVPIVVRFTAEAWPVRAYQPTRIAVARSE